MASTISESVLSAEQFAELPEPREGGKMELVRGRVIIEMPVSGKHGERQLVIGTALRSFVRPRGIGHVGVESGFILARDPDVVLAPDVSVIPSSRLPSGELPEVGFIEAAPLLAVEVISPNDSEGRAISKAGEYLDAGVERVWLVQAKTRSVVVFFEGAHVETVEMGGVLTSRQAGFEVEGFELPVSEIFE